MPLNRRTTRVFHRVLYATQLEKVTCLKRNDDQAQGTVTSYVLYQCRFSKIHKHGQAIQGEMASDHTRWLHIPDIQMKRVGINYFNVLDRFVDKEGRTWQPESGDMIRSQLFENQLCILCRMVDGRELHG